MPDLKAGYNLIRVSALMVRRRPCAVSNHESTLFILRDAAKTPLLRMRLVRLEKA
jgi:hypothetical protein